MKIPNELEKLGNEHVNDIVRKYADLCKPSGIRILTDSKEDIEAIKKLAMANNEEQRLATKGHTIHFDSYHDQGRDLLNTRVLIPKGRAMSKSVETKDREEGLHEIFQLLDGIMKGKEMLVKFYCLGPENSRFSIPAMQVTDSAYVLHSEDILYRQGYSEFMRLKGSGKFFHFVHSSGRTSNGISTDIDKRRVYMDLEENRVFTVNNQYAGNSIGLKKLALRLAINKSNTEDWLCEHMFIMGVHPEGKNRVTYFTGAFPSACGKTSTAMIPGQSIIGDDIAYIRPGADGNAYAVNVEQGMFGIIEDVNPVDDALIYKVLTTPREIIFSNVLVNNGRPYWLGMGSELPEKGFNHSGEWYHGKTDPSGNVITASHKNARYTVRISELENADPKSDDPDGVPVSAFIYGGRDSDTTPPVVQSLSWSHGVFMGAAIESETTAAAIGKVGVRKHNPMSNIEFLTVPLGVYIKNHIKFGESLEKRPLVFSTNYFLKENGDFINQKIDKKVWLMWMEGRVHGEYDAIKTPIGFIPFYNDISRLFRKILGSDYKRETYDLEFSIRISRLLEKLDRIEAIYRQEHGIPDIFHDHIRDQRQRLLDLRRKAGKDVVSPDEIG